MDYNNRKKNTNFTPAPGRNAKLDSYIESFRLRTVYLTTKQNQKKMFHNISLQEQMAINDLKSNHAVAIKPADKGGAVVIMNTQDYIKEGDRQLSGDKYYRNMKTSPRKNPFIKSFPENLHLELQSLMPSSPYMGTFYMLPIITGMGTHRTDLRTGRKYPKTSSHQCGIPVQQHSTYRWHQCLLPFPLLCQQPKIQPPNYQRTGPIHPRT
ncbi:Hypothetical predicted protein [Pelobates cultripes]|uniref:Uncharacterized protein n=1 Tax=Pelobates cultripes TaxID=61616 RepID=A0AAD1VLE0_PELCU|nr:Hypothetical predicted protein [Pelobates cultripes]